MKKTIFSMILLAGTLCACNPVCDDTPLGSVVNESDLQLDVHATTEGGNQIVMINNTKGVGSYWDYVIGHAAAQCDTVVMPFLGKQTITFTGLCDGGTVTTTRTVDIKKIDHPLAAEWAYFAGSGVEGKTWTWDDSADAVYGTGGYLAEFVPDWTSVALGDTEDPNAYMVFDLNGGPNFTRYGSTGKVVEKGTFAFDMTSTKVDPDDGSQWSIGTLTLTGATVLNGHIYGSTAVQSKFDILTLNDDKMVLCAAPDGTAAWDNGTFWLFKKK
ncbi:MAG: hypothetical protein LKG25_01575 [Prevotella sp.]|jgi:hypothetical protein|nr:hypothetical protein [Prevotella sp.]MCI1281268.1 hypothetical protein [Prevotella sp.]